MSAICIGPYENFYRISVDGYVVPYIDAYPVDTLMTKWHLTLDHRFGIDLDENQLQEFMWWIANAMAIAAGYTSHGENCLPRNPHNTRLMELGNDRVYVNPKKDEDK